MTDLVNVAVAMASEVMGSRRVHITVISLN